MSTTPTKPRPPSRGRDAEARARLASTLASLAEVEASYAASLQAVAETQETHSVNSVAWSEASAELTLQKQRQPRLPQHLADAEAVFAKAEAAWEETAAALRRAEEAAQGAAAPLEFRRGFVRDAALAVFRTEAGAAAAALAAEIIPLQRRLAERVAVLDWFERQGVPLLGGDRLALALRGNLMDAMGLTGRGGRFFPPPEWQAALDALQLDADAALPA